MRQLGIRGAIRGGGGPRTTKSDTADERPADLVERDFSAEAPNAKWVADLTYVRTRSGFVYAAFVIDCHARAIVGWNVARRMTTDLVLTAAEQAIWDRLGAASKAAGLIHHSDAGSQRGFNWSSQHLDDGGGGGPCSSISRWRRSDRCGARSGRGRFTMPRDRCEQCPETRHCRGHRQETPGQEGVNPSPAWETGHPPNCGGGQ
jgi:hypothetical protein